MILFLAICLVYILLLLYVKPAPASLKAKPLTFSENIVAIKASFIVGLLLVIIFLLIGGFSSSGISADAYSSLALNNVWSMSALWPLQAITHLFVHLNLYHLVSNVAGVGLASVYERRVGSKRFLIVLIISSLASIPSVFFYTEATAVCGISGGVFGLAMAYFTDHKNLTTKEWLVAILVAAFLIVIFTVGGEMRTGPQNKMPFQIDYLGHVLGAIGAVIYCRSKPLK